MNVKVDWLEKEKKCRILDGEVAANKRDAAILHVNWYDAVVRYLELRYKGWYGITEYLEPIRGTRGMTLDEAENSFISECIRKTGRAPRPSKVELKQALEESA